MQPSSRRVGSDCSTTPPSSRDDLEDTLGNELGGHTWQFSAATVARMLSAKTRKSPLGPQAQGRDTLDAYDCDVDELTPALDLAYASFIEKDWPWPAPCGEKDQHPYFAKFLNGCVEVCHQALDTCEFKVKKADRWYSDLKFIPYGRPTKDSVPGVSSVYPSLTGGRDLQNDMLLYWSPLDESTPPILLPVEVNSEWLNLVCKAAVYAYCLFSASPSRQYALVLGIECAKRELRFMIFHRGGLSASTSLSMEGDYKEILGLFLAILTWKSAEDAGFALWCNDIEFCLPRDKNDKVGIIARTEKVLSSCPCVRGRATMVSHVSYPGNTPPPPTMEPSSAIAAAPTPTTCLRSSAHLKDKQMAGEELGEIFLSDTTPQAVTEEKPDGKRPVLNVVGRRGREVEFVANHRNTHFKVPMQSLPPKTEKRADAVVKFSWPPDDTYGMEAEILEQCSGKFGLPMHHCSFQACYSSGQPMSNHLFLPQEESDLNNVHWKVFVPVNTAAPSPEHRSLWVHVSAVVGRPLECAKTPWELFQSVAHAMLGWLSMLQSGYLHRDISIGNILMVEEAVEMPNFAITDPDDLVDEFEKPPLAGTTKGPNVEQDLMGLLDDLNISDKCLGFTIDLDMAASLKTTFNKTHDRERTGTREFMSEPLLESMRFSKPYLQSPVDDLCSSYYVGQWAAVFNLSNSGQALSQEFQALRNKVAGGAAHRLAASTKIGKLSEWDIEAYPAFLVHCAPVFRKWHASIDQLVTDWDDVVYAFAEDVSKEKADDYYKPHFRAFAFRGVKEYLEILKEYRLYLMDYRVDKSDI